MDGVYQIITDTGIQSIYQWMTPKGKATLLRLASHLPANKTIPLYEDVVLPAFSGLGEEDDDEDAKSGTDGRLSYALLACLYKWDHAEEVLTILNNWIRLAFTKEGKKAGRKPKAGKRSKKTVENAASQVTGDTSSKSLLAMKLLGMLMVHFRAYK